MEERRFDDIESLAEDLSAKSDHARVVGSVGALAGIGFSALAVSGPIGVIAILGAVVATVVSAYSLLKKITRDSLIEKIEEVRRIEKQDLKKKIEAEILVRDVISLTTADVEKIRKMAISSQHHRSGSRFSGVRRAKQKRKAEDC